MSRGPQVKVDPQFVSDRMTALTRTLLSTAEPSERLSAAAIADYEQQLANVEQQREGLRAMIAQLWQTIGRERPN